MLVGGSEVCNLVQSKWLHLPNKEIAFPYSSAMIWTSICLALRGRGEGGREGGREGREGGRGEGGREGAEKEINLLHILFGKFHDKDRGAWDLSLDLNIGEWQYGNMNSW